MLRPKEEAEVGKEGRQDLSITEAAAATPFPAEPGDGLVCVEYGSSRSLHTKV